MAAPGAASPDDRRKAVVVASGGSSLDICYVDEAGSSELLSETTTSSTPVLVIAGLIVPDGSLKGLIWDFLQLKKEFNRSLQHSDMQLSDIVAAEIKGHNLRGDLRTGGRNDRRRAIGIIEKVLSIVGQRQCRLIARVIVKAEGVAIDDRRVYGASIGWICRTFHHYLEERDQTGLVVLDSRTKVKNTPNSDVITTQIFKSGGDQLPRFCEVPLFGHSDSHVALQISDIIASAVLFPAACAAYCADLTWNVHAHESYDEIRVRFGTTIKHLQYRYKAPSVAQWWGGIYALGASRVVRTVDMFASPDATPTLPGVKEAADAATDVGAPFRNACRWHETSIRMA